MDIGVRRYADAAVIFQISKRLCINTRFNNIAAMVLTADIKSDILYPHS